MLALGWVITVAKVPVCMVVLVLMLMLMLMLMLVPWLVFPKSQCHLLQGESTNLQPETN